MFNSKQPKCAISSNLSRRAFMVAGTTAAIATSANLSLAKPQIKMFKNLGGGHIGISANQLQAIELASTFGFGGCNPHIGDILKMSVSERKELVALMKEKELQWGAAGLSVDFRRDEARFKDGFAKLPKAAEAMQQCGINRVATWILPGSNELTYVENFKMHQKRLRNCAMVFEAHDIRLGLEFVGPHTMRSSFKFTFASTQREMLELCQAIGKRNMGLLLDSWHWHTSHGTLEELDQLTNDLIVNVHVNDAPSGVEVNELVDNRRALPCTTGVIDLKGFMGKLVKLGYDGPVTCEPFDNDLRALDNEPALKKTIASLDKLFELI